MSDNYIKVTVTGNKSKSVSVKSTELKNQITAGADMSIYYSNKAKEWAISDKLVDNEDYSSKYHANLAKSYTEEGALQIAEITTLREQTLADIETEKQNVIDMGTEQINQVSTISNTAISDIETSKTNALSDIDSAKNIVLEDISTQETQTINNIKETADVELDKIVGAGIDSRANIDLSNLSEVGEKHFLGKSQITNCITEIPQRIKADVVDGTLTVYAGSVAIVPYGNTKRDFINVGGVTLDSEHLIASGFDGTNYLQLLRTPTFGSNWEILFKFTTGDDITTAQSIFSLYPFALALNIKNSLIQVYFSTNGTSFNLANAVNGVTTLTANTTYYCKYTYDGSNYEVSLSTDNVDWTTEFTTTNSTALCKATRFQIGQYTAINPFLGSVDLSECYIDIAGQRWWDCTQTLEKKYPVGGTFIHENFKVVDTQLTDNKFFVWVQVQNDIAKTPTISDTITRHVEILISKNEYVSVTNTISDTTQYSGTANNVTYRTDLNIIQSTISGTLQDDVVSFPIVITPADGTYVHGSITQTFNGIGYIGSTIWVDKGVKGLIPNGRNADDTCKNIETVTNQLYTLTETVTRTNMKGTLYTHQISNTSQEVIIKDDNILYIADVPHTALVFATFDRTAGVISNFNPKQPFRAVDYSDLGNLYTTTKATTTSSASADRPAVVVQNYKNSYSWYRVWSDGWIEQGARFKGNGGNTTVTFPKAFTVPSYTLQVQAFVEGDTEWDANPSTLTTTGFTQYEAGSIYYVYYACGY